MKSAIVDTSSIVFGFEYKKNVFDSIKRQLPDYVPAVSKSIIRELERLSTIKGKKGISARTALLALKSKKVRVYNINVSADLWITRQASSEKGSIVISNDTELIRALCWKHVPCFKISKSGMLKRTFK